MNHWITAKASVAGASHHKNKTPCQDSSAVIADASGKWLIIVVSDGAGTATRAEEGSSLVVDLFSNALLSLASELSFRKPGSWINDFVIEKILEVRKRLRLKAASEDIRDFNCTLVACLQGASGGFSIHIGDGAIFGGRRLSSDSPEHSLAPERFFISPPENGEYANETYFITEGDWVKHLRIMPMPPLDWVFACTDGGTALSLVSDKEPKEKFILPVLQEILKKETYEERNITLSKILSDPQADKVTGDDKTIVIACRKNKAGFFGMPYINKLEQQDGGDIKARREEPVDISNNSDKTKETDTNRRRFSRLRATIYALAALTFLITLYIFASDFPVKSKSTAEKEPVVTDRRNGATDVRRNGATNSS